MTTIDGTNESTGEPGPVAELEYNMYLVEPVLSHALKMDQLREQHAIFKSTFAQGYYCVTRMDAVRDCLQRPDIFSSSSVVPIEPEPPYKWIPEMLDPPVHTRWRQLLAPLFSPTAMTKMEDKVRERCVELIEPLVERGRCDFLRDFAWRYPTTIFMELMGLPVSEADKFLEWENAILHLPIDQDPDRSKAVQAMNDVQAYFADLIKVRRQEPKDDLLSTALTWRIDGAPISDADMLAFCLLMFMAGLDTVSIQLAYSFYQVATHRDDRRRIVEEPEIIPKALEELLRAYSFVVTGRKVMEDTEVEGCPIKVGEMVSLWIPAACRDPRAFPEPAKVDFDRTANNHIAFGAGAHRCLGSHLARRELRFALEEWHKRIPEYRLHEDIEVVEHGGMFGIDSLALVWDA